MGNFYKKLHLKCIAFLAVILFSTTASFAQTETFPTGSAIIDMGVTPQTIGNALKPYGMIYDLIRNYNVPVKWIINPSKVKDGADFTYNAKVYRGGPFVIPVAYLTPAVVARIPFWTGQGVMIDYVGATPLTVPTSYVSATLTAVPKWTLDAANGSIAQGYLTNAGITNLTFSAGAYNFKAVSALDCCDDFFVMPHADPTWATHNRLFTWNQTCLGSVWAACHAVSALENSINPANTTQQMNFLSTRTAAVSPTPWPNNSLKLWGTHSGGSVPYTHTRFADPVAQYIGTTDAAQLNGSEQIYIPKQSTDPGGATRWRPETNIVAYDPSQVNVPVPNLANGNVAAVIAYGRGLGDNNRGFVMYEAGHSHNKGTASDVAAQRAFWNFSFYQLLPKAPQLTVTGITGGEIIPGTSTITGLNVAATSPLVGVTFNYQWSSSCGGTFSSATGATTNFTAPSVSSNTACIISIRVSDNCGRSTTQSFPVTIKAANPPTATPDVATLDPGCGGTPSIIKNVLANDSDPNGDPITLTQVNGNTLSPFTIPGQGTVSFTSGGDVTFTAAEGFTGVVNLTYQVCDNTTPTPLCSNSTYTITVGDANKVPTVAADAATIAEDLFTPTSINVLTNDVQLGGYTGGALSVRSVISGPANGRVSVNPDNTITYVPNADFAGTDNFTYEVVNASGYRRSAVVTVTVTNNSCDGNTYEVTAPSSGSLTLTMTTGASGDVDTYLNQDGTPGGNSLRNFGTCVDVSVNRRDGDRAMRGLVKFNLSSIPSGATVTSATLRLYLNREGGAAYDISAHKVLESWDEGTICNNNGVANWTVRSGTVTNWSTLGGVFGAALSTTNIPRTTGVYYQWTGLQTTVNEWLGSPSTNYGFLLKAVTENIADDRFEFDSREATNKPQLVINYTIPAVCGAIPNRAPLANPDYGYSTNSVTPLVISNVKANDTDEGALTVTGATLISGSGTVGSITANGFTFTPTSGVTGTAVVEYTVSDGLLTDVARVTITVTNAPISATNDVSSANSGVVQIINVMSNDTDPENQKGVLSIVTPPANGSAVVFDNGTPANFADDIIRYTPNAGYTGTDAFTYQICEALPASTCPVTPNCATASVNITVVNQPPVAVNDGFNFPPCQSTKINLVGNDTDPETGLLTVNIVTPPATGTLVNNNDGTVTYTPVTGTGSPITFTYTITDNGVAPLTSAPATVTLTLVSPVNGSPVAGNDVTDPQYMGEIFYTSVLDNDSDPDNNPLTLPVITVAPLFGTATVLPNGLIEYIPNPGWYGSDILTYQVCDIINNPATCVQSNDICVTATVSYVILPPQNTTNAINDEHSTWQDVNVSNNVLINDLDMENDAQVLGGFFDKDAGIYNTSGTFNVYAEDGITLAGQITVSSNGDFTFDPASTFTGVVSLPYFINDVVSPTGSKPTSGDTALLKITVNPLPAIANSIIANNDEYATPLNTNVVSNVTAYNDFDPQGNTFSVTSYTFDSDGNGTQDGTGTLGSAIQIGGISTTGIPTTNAGTLLLNADGTFTFNPKDDFTGSIDVVYTITDALGAVTTAVLHIDVLPDTNGAANDSPFAGDDFKYTNVNTPVSGNALSNDSDPNGHTIAATPQTTTIPGVGTLVLAANGAYTFTPAAGYTGPAAFPYTICDNQAPALCTDATLHFLVGVDNTTDAINDENSTWQDVNVGGSVVVNDFDAERNTQTFGGFWNGATYNSTGTINVFATDGTTAAGSLTINNDGTYVFDPLPGFIGVMRVRYQICDNGNLARCDTASLLITVTPYPGTVNSLIANNDENISYGAPVSNSVTVNDDDPQQLDAFNVTSFGPANTTPGTPITVAGLDENGNAVVNAGTLVINTDGSYTYTPAAGFTGSINVPYTITDNNVSPASATAILHIDVLKDPNGPANDPPFGGDDFKATTLNTTVSGSVLLNDGDVNGNTLTVTPQTTTVAGGTLTLLSDGTYTFVPANQYVGPVVFYYQVCDGQTPNLCATAELHFLVSPEWALPVTGLDLTVRLNGSNAVLDWKTETEINSDYFIVERSIDNRNFIAVGTVAAAGNSQTRRNYSYTDNVSSLFSANAIYYRIRQVDIDARFTHSKVVVIRLGKTAGVKAWPNPFIGSISINIQSEANTSVNVKLYSSTGQLLQLRSQQVSRGTTQVILSNLEALAQGIYLLQVEDINGMIRFTEKFVKE